MAKMIEIPDLTKKQEECLRALLSDASYEAIDYANEKHMSALKAKTHVEVVELEKIADELRAYAQVLSNIAAKI